MIGAPPRLLFERNPESVIRTVLLILLFALMAGPARATERVDLELVLATDVSRSIDESEARLQREGTAAAIRNPEVIRAIAGGYFKRIAVAYIDYSSVDYNEVIIDWTIISDKASAHAFAKRLTDAPLTFGRRTSISDGIEMASKMITGNAFEGLRRVIDVSGDGPNNDGRLVDEVRNETIAKRITINGLPIISPPGGFGSRFWLEDLDKYYQGCVVGGRGAFMIVAKDFKDYARAIRRKLVFEIAGLMPSPAAPIKPAAAHAPGISPNGYTYRKGCDIGERQRQQRLRDFGDFN